MHEEKFHFNLHIKKVLNRKLLQQVGIDKALVSIWLVPSTNINDVERTLNEYIYMYIVTRTKHFAEGLHDAEIV